MKDKKILFLGGRSARLKAVMKWILKNYLWCSFFVLLTVALIFPFQDADLFFYLRLGKTILENGSIPSQDPYLYTVSNWWVFHEWLSYVVFYLSYWLGGWGGPVALKVILWGGGFLALASTARKWKIQDAVAAVLLLLAALVSSHRFVERASLFSDILWLTFSLYLMRAEKPTRKALLAIPLAFILWVNLHPGFILGLALFTVYVFTYRRPLSLWFSLLASYAACLLNPRGLEGAIYPIQTALKPEWELFKKLNFEWMPTFQEPFLSTWEVQTLIGLLIVTTGLLAMNWFRRPRQNLFPLFVFAMNLYLAQMASRFMPTAALGFAALSLFALRDLRWQLPFKAERILTVILTVLFLGSAGWIVCKGYTSASGPRTFGVGVDPQNFPVKAVEFIESHHLQGRIFNQYDWGSYLVWSLNPDHTLFIHGHVDDPKLLAYGYHGMNGSRERFESTVKKYDIQYFLLDKTKLRFNPPIPILENLRNWIVLYQDDTSILWGRP